MKRPDLIKLFQPYADQLAVELADAAVNHIEGLLERARDYAINKLRAELEGKADGEEEDGPGDRDGRRHRVPRSGGRRKKSGASRGVANRTVRARATPSKKERSAARAASRATTRGRAGGKSQRSRRAR
jgi:hypothetical protein